MLAVPVTTMVKRALSMLSPTAKDSMLAPAASAPSVGDLHVDLHGHHAQYLHGNQI